PVDATSYLKVPQKERTVIACADTGSKDLIPCKILLSYAPPNNSTPANNGNKEYAAPPETTKPKKADSKPETKAKHHLVVTVKQHDGGASTQAASQPVEQGVTTIVHKDPASILAVDVALLHQ